MDDNAGMGILGVIIGAIILFGVIFYALGENPGRGSSGANTSVKVELPKPSKN